MDLSAKFKSIIQENRYGLAIILLAWVVFFAPLLSGKYIYFLDDLKIIYYPIEHEYAQAQSELRLPTWSNSFGFGHPLIAWGQLGFFTPLHLILRTLSVSPLNLLQISIVAYFGLGLLGMYAFMRHRAFGQPAAALAATLFAFNGFAIGHLNHVNFYISTMLLPWLLITAYLLIQKPTVSRTLYLSLVAAAVTVSGQPQVVMFVFIAAAILSIAYAIELYWPVAKSSWKALGKLLGYTAIAAIISLLLSAFSVLPLFEFIPQTERIDGLPTYELYEFSYPPWHAITLIAPYFFGDHNSYWGAKGFQELAAFVGLIPLFLAGIALSRFSSHKAEKIASGIFIAITLALALGRYSPIYIYLVENHILTSIGVAGRFIYFFTIAITLLAAVGLEDVTQNLTANNLKHYVRQLISGLVFTVAIFTPFIWYMNQDSVIYTQATTHLLSLNATSLALLLSILSIALLAFYRVIPQQYRRFLPTALVCISTLTLVMYAWSYNPRMLRSSVQDSLIFIDELQEYNKTHNTPARLYSRPTLLQNTGAPARTEPISPQLSVFQPVVINYPNVSCFEVPLQASGPTQGSITIGLHREPLEESLRTVNISSEQAGSIPQNKVCFDTLDTQPGETYWLSFKSTVNSGVVLLQQTTDIEEYQAYLVRVEEPTDVQWERSRKPLTILVEPLFTSRADTDAAILARHINVLADTSSARWIGALSIQNYRDFIEFFFANDQEPFDGDGLHAIERYRDIVNMSGITHLAQIIPPTHSDRMSQSGYTAVSEEDIGSKKVVLYENPEAFTKAFMVPNAMWVPAADNTRAHILDPAFDPSQVVFVSGPTPPQHLSNQSEETMIEQTVINTTPLQYTADITSYTPTEVTVDVTSGKNAWLIVSDATTPHWQTYIDNAPAPQYVAHSVFKAAYVPAGTHTVTFRYESPAISTASKAFVAGIVSLLLLALVTIKTQYRRKSS